MITIVAGLFSVLTLFLFYRAGIDAPPTLSPQGCRMSYMSPSYILQSDFNASWSPLSRRYSLSLYREVGWEANQVNGVPVLFIPGNAGSSHQVRSIASSATRQYYSSPYVKAPEFAHNGLRQLDFFAVEFNEDLSAFHGPTLDSQIAYTSRAISYILSLYPPGTAIVVMGHSMGGVVAMSLLPSEHISALITMSTPHTLPPARFDARIDKIYAANRQMLFSDPTPILSLCGGATDMMIPSESCILPDIESPTGHNATGGIYRKTVFTSALEGAWTGVGHREMVWCHQVRWRVARAALELGASSHARGRAIVLDKWLSDGRTLSLERSNNLELNLSDPSSIEIIPLGMDLVLKRPRGSLVYMLPVPSGRTAFVLYVSQGSISRVSSQNPIPFRASIYLCHHPAKDATTSSCRSLAPSILKLIPNPIPGKKFPAPDEGSDESEGVVFYETKLSNVDAADMEAAWIAVRTEAGDGRGWVVGGFVSDQAIENQASAYSPFFGSATIHTAESGPSLRRDIRLPNLISSTLVVYRVVPAIISPSACSDSLLPPLLQQTSEASESHFYPLFSSHQSPVLVHTHSSAPYIPKLKQTLYSGLNFTVFSSRSPECTILSINITVDWWSTFGRWAMRYPMTLLSWAVGVVALVILKSWRESDNGAPTSSVHHSLTSFVRRTLPGLLFVSFIIALLPLPARFYMGNEGKVMFAPLAPLILMVATGLVCLSWLFLVLLMWPIGKIAKVGNTRQSERSSIGKGAAISMMFVFVLIFLFVPWQVAFLGCWIIHLYTCAAQSPLPPGSQVSSPTPAIPLIPSSGHEASPEPEVDPKGCTRRSTSYRLEKYHHNTHLLLLMTWLLPLVAPVLAVWVRTLLTAGVTVPFDGDHNFLHVAPFLILVDFASRSNGPLFERQPFEDRVSTTWSLIVLAVIAFFEGPRKAYRIFDTANIVIAFIVFVRIGPRYWGGYSWSSPRIGR